MCTEGSESSLCVLFLQKSLFFHTQLAQEKKLPDAMETCTVQGIYLALRLKGIAAMGRKAGFPMPCLKVTYP